MSTEQTRDQVVRYEPLARTPLPDVIAEQLLAEIDSGTLRPGDRLPSEPELARQLQVGRSSLREAIRKLHTLGVLDVVRGRGTFVRHRTEPEPTPQFVHWSATQGPAIAEVLEVRIGLELAASGLACVRATQADIDAVAARCREHEAARRKGDLDVLVHTDEQVHESLIRAARNDLLLQMYLALVPQMREFRAHTLALGHADERFDPHHRAMLAGLVKRDPAMVREAVVQHVGALYGEVKAAGTVETGRQAAGQMLDYATILANFT
ncbi:FCD domain-containing protein [Nonomuraea sp. NPDC046802]|uniref:FadR/GntR family transcriptional regulator n=1 Tax=Nonomuraea sp. NPDC046802 TaxID=3154919 RepID=UPI0033F4869A